MKMAKQRKLGIISMLHTFMERFVRLRSARQSTWPIILIDLKVRVVESVVHACVNLARVKLCSKHTVQTLE